MALKLPMVVSLTVLAIGATLTPSYAAPPVSMSADTLIGARQAAFAFMAGNFGAMKAAVKAGSSPHDFADVTDDMVEWGELIPAMFPPGTEAGRDTKALKTVWSDSAGFARDAAAFVTAAKALKAAAASDDKAGFASAFKATGQACGACHKGYRAKD